MCRLDSHTGLYGMVGCLVWSHFTRETQCAMGRYCWTGGCEGGAKGSGYSANQVSALVCWKKDAVERHLVVWSKTIDCCRCLEMIYVC